MPEIAASLRAEVRARANGRCEYCLVPEALTLVPHEIDHIIAAKHGGESLAGNLALCCALCNKHKGTDVASMDPENGDLTRLFHPRIDRWSDHFQLRGGLIAPVTAIGHATARLLQFNRSQRIKERELMVSAGLL